LIERGGGVKPRRSRPRERGPYDRSVRKKKKGNGRALEKVEKKATLLTVGGEGP